MNNFVNDISADEKQTLKDAFDFCKHEKERDPAFDERKYFMKTFSERYGPERGEYLISYMYHLKKMRDQRKLGMQQQQQQHLSTEQMFNQTGNSTANQIQYLTPTTHSLPSNSNIPSWSNHNNPNNSGNHQYPHSAQSHMGQVAVDPTMASYEFQNTNILRNSTQLLPNYQLHASNPQISHPMPYPSVSYHPVSDGKVSQQYRIDDKSNIAKSSTMMSDSNNINTGHNSVSAPIPYGVNGTINSGLLSAYPASSTYNNNNYKTSNIIDMTDKESTHIPRDTPSMGGVNRSNHGLVPPPNSMVPGTGNGMNVIPSHSPISVVGPVHAAGGYMHPSVHPYGNGGGLGLGVLPSFDGHDDQSWTRYNLLDEHKVRMFSSKVIEPYGCRIDNSAVRALSMGIQMHMSSIIELSINNFRRRTNSTVSESFNLMKKCLVDRKGEVGEEVRRSLALMWGYNCTSEVNADVTSMNDLYKECLTNEESRIVDLLNTVDEERKNSSKKRGSGTVSAEGVVHKCLEKAKSDEKKGLLGFEELALTRCKMDAASRALSQTSARPKRIKRTNNGDGESSMDPSSSSSDAAVVDSTNVSGSGAGSGNSNMKNLSSQSLPFAPQNSKINQVGKPSQDTSTGSGPPPPWIPDDCPTDKTDFTVKNSRSGSYLILTKADVVSSITKEMKTMQGSKYSKFSNELGQSIKRAKFATNTNSSGKISSSYYNSSQQQQQQQQQQHAPNNRTSNYGR